MERKNPLGALNGWIALALMLAPGLATRAADRAFPTGMIEGRVLNSSNGDYIEGARVIVDGAGRAHFPVVDCQSGSGVPPLKVMTNPIPARMYDRLRTSEVFSAAGRRSHFNGTDRNRQPAVAPHRKVNVHDTF